MSEEKSKKPIRMCVVCKKRFLQKELLRYSIQEQKIVKHCGFGRSLYLCFLCKEKNREKATKILNGKHKIDIESIKLVF